MAKIDEDWSACRMYVGIFLTIVENKTLDVFIRLTVDFPGLFPGKIPNKKHSLIFSCKKSNSYTDSGFRDPVQKNH